MGEGLAQACTGSSWRSTHSNRNWRWSGYGTAATPFNARDPRNEYRIPRRSQRSSADPSGSAQSSAVRSSDGVEPQFSGSYASLTTASGDRPHERLGGKVHPATVPPLAVLPQAHRRRTTLEFRAASPPVPALAAPSPQLRPPALRAAARYAPRSASPPPPSGGARACSSPLTIRRDRFSAEWMSRKRRIQCRRIAPWHIGKGSAVV